jgi:hypothetical protein
MRRIPADATDDLGAMGWLTTLVVQPIYLFALVLVLIGIPRASSRSSPSCQDSRPASCQASM